MDCSTIIVSYNTFEFTAEAVRSALESSSTIEHEVIVVDNASPDESARRLREAFPQAEFPQVNVIASPDNLGFSRANNVGAASASGRVLFFLNPDTVVHGDAIPRLVTLLDERPDVGAVGPRVLNADGTDQFSAYSFHSADVILRHYLFPFSKRFVRSNSEIDFVKGCAIAVTRTAFDAVGGWDDSYFMYSEETELCWRLKDRGLKTYFLYDVKITHLGGVASRERYVEQQVMAVRSDLQFLRRHGSFRLVALNRVAGAVGFSIRAVAFRLGGIILPKRADDYRLRRQAASRLWRWFLLEYA